jgi:L-aminopeptidase/D-esterase-like protein
MDLTNSITDIPGITVGQAQDLESLTGCSVIICTEGAVGGVNQRGGAPGTRETDLLRPMHMIQKIHAVMLSGGSAFGLDAASGAMQYLEEQKVGFNSGAGLVPIVPSAVLFDLAIGNAAIRPDKAMGYQACQQASAQKPREGNFGAGTGASVGKIMGMGQAMKSGIGTSSREIAPGILIGAIAAVNALGDIIDYQTNQIVAGVRSLSKGPIKIGADKVFANTLEIMQSKFGRIALSFVSKQNTIIGVIATNASLDKEGASKFAEAASNGIAISTRPAFTMLDGDTIFSMTTCKKKADLNLLCAFAPLVFADAMLNAVKQAEPAGGLPSAQSISREK